MNQSDYRIILTSGYNSTYKNIIHISSVKTELVDLRIVDHILEQPNGSLYDYVFLNLYCILNYIKNISYNRLFISHETYDQSFINDLESINESKIIDIDPLLMVLYANDALKINQAIPIKNNQIWCDILKYNNSKNQISSLKTPWETVFG
jgi:hypothetical protein